MSTRKRYTLEFQEQACRLAGEPGYTRQQAADELGINISTLRGWLLKRGRVSPSPLVEPDYAASDDPRLLKDHIRELEKRLKRAELEKEILEKATAFFASQNP
jgi:transposase